MNISFIYISIAFFFHLQLVQCKNILAIFPHFGISHYYMYEPYVEKLAERGHTITLVTWFNVTNLHENIKHISFGRETIPFNLNLVEYEKGWISPILMTFFELQILNQWGQQMCSEGLQHPSLKEILKSKKKFDLVIVEYFNSDCFAVFSYLLKAPLIGIFSSAPMPWHNDRMGNPDNPSYIVNMFNGYQSEMNFFNRLKNTISLFFCKTYYKYINSKPTDRIIKAHLGKGIPKINDIVSNTSLYIINSHFSLFQPRPFVPGVVEVGGLHVQEPKNLPSDLDKIVKNSKDGVIYFSLGTVTKGSTLPEKKKNSLLKVLGNVSETVIWKWEIDDMPEKPKNVFLKKWIPQNDLLANPKVKLFITHGGLMGILEAVTHGVPMIIIPLFGDQFLNAAAVAEKGAGIVVDYFSLTEKKFQQVLKTVLEDKSYTENAKLLAAKFKERPLSPMNAAIYWTEYVLKFKGAPHLRSAVTKLSWFSEYLLDITIFIIIVVVLSAYLGKKALCKMKEIRNAQKASQQKKKK